MLRRERRGNLGLLGVRDIDDLLDPAPAGVDDDPDPIAVLLGATSLPSTNSKRPPRSVWPGHL